MSNEIINVIGLGYIGLPTALILAANGNKVIGTDYNSNVVNALRDGTFYFSEDGIDDLYEAAVKKNIEFTTEYRKAKIYIVVNAVNSILDVCNDDVIIVIESTISPGTIDKYIRPLIKGRKVNLVHAPERIIPGNMIKELKGNSRTIGADSQDIANQVKDLYASFCKGNIITTDIRTAEMTKVVENTFRDINIAFANELAKICRAADLDVYEIIRIANMHPRVNILSPGPGVGGHCISVDPWFLVGDYPGLANIILAARKINDSMPEFVLERINEIMKKENIKDTSRVGFYGLTYKENVDDVRESPTLQLLESMEKHLCGNVKTYDPYIKEEIVSNQYFDIDQFLNDIDLLVVMVGHNEIINNFDKIKNKIIFDTRNVIDLPGVYYL